MSITVTVNTPSVVPSVTNGVEVVVNSSGGFDSSTVGAVMRVSVANIDDPSAELAAITGTLAAGSIRIATQDVAGVNAYRIYVLDSASSTAQSTPYRIDRSAGGQWVLIGGKGVNGDFAVNGAVTLTTDSSGLTIAKTTGTTLTVSSTDAATTTGNGCAIFAGGIGIAGAWQAGVNSKLAAESNAALSITVNNTSTGTGASARAVYTNDASVSALNISYGSSATATNFGITMANYIAYLGSGASVAGMVIGPTGSASAPLVFGQGSSERFRLDSSGNLVVNTSTTLTLSKTTGTTLTVSSTDATCASFGGGASFANQIAITATVATGLLVVNTSASGSSTGSGIVARSDDGAAMANGDRLGLFAFSGARAAATYSSSACVSAFTTEAWGAGAAGTELRMEVTPNGSNTRGAVAKFDRPSGAGETGMYLWDVDNGQLERVTVGAADSGGAGFKLLRIPN